jgi:hypothetical protein
MIIEYGYDFIVVFPDCTGRPSRRPWLYTIPLLKKNLGVNVIDAALMTHYHDDHVAGLNLLQQVEHTAIWAPRNFAEILSDPSRYNLPCLWFDPIKVDVVQPLEKQIRWEEFNLTLSPLPGHTSYAVAILLEADGKRILFTGMSFRAITARFGIMSTRTVMLSLITDWELNCITACDRISSYLDPGLHSTQMKTTSNSSRNVLSA